MEQNLRKPSEKSVKMIHEQKYMFTNTEMNHHLHTCKNSVWSLH
jgi:hypothetical protein